MDRTVHRLCNQDSRVPVPTCCPTRTSKRPLPISVILAGVLLKMGNLGILRGILRCFLPPATQLAWLFLGVIGTINIVYGAMCAMAQTDYRS